MSIAHDLIAQYGTLAVFAGCLMEGETFAVVGGFFAHQKTLVLSHVLLAAGIGSTLGDVILYFAGRSFGSTNYVRNLKRKPMYRRAMRLIRRNETGFVLSNRFIYGVRGVGGIAIGIAGVAPLKFMVLNALSATVWTALFVSAGYFFGASVETLIGRVLHGHERLAIAAVLLVGITITAYFAARRYVRRRAGEEDGAGGETGLS